MSSANESSCKAKTVLINLKKHTYTQQQQQQQKTLNRNTSFFLKKIANGIFLTSPSFSIFTKYRKQAVFKNELIEYKAHEKFSSMEMLAYNISAR